jgi:hypothetical protein
MEQAMAVTHLIDSNHNDTDTFAPGDRVRVKAREGVFIVLRVDENAGEAAVLSCEPGPCIVDTGIPLNLISLDYDYLPELFRWYVEEAPIHGVGGMGR